MLPATYPQTPLFGMLPSRSAFSNPTSNGVLSSAHVSPEQLLKTAQRAAAALRNLGDETAVRAALVRLLRHQHQQRRLPPAFRKPLQPLAAVYNGKLIAKHRRGERSATAADGAPSAD